MKQLSLYYEDGHAAVAQQLHAMGEHNLVIAVPQRGTKPGGVIGGQKMHRVFTAQRATKPWVISGPGPGHSTQRRTVPPLRGESTTG